jgi:aryl carrier-like protein
MSPGPIEIILRSSPLVADALVVGSNRPQVGCLVFPAQFPPPPTLIQQITELIKQANAQSPSHAQLGNEMCFVVVEQKRAEDLPKSSKGTIQRGVAYETYKDEIDRLYGDGEGGQKLDVSGDELKSWLKDKVAEIIGDSKRYEDDILDSQTDLFSWGVDSVKAARLRFAMMRVSRLIRFGPD